MTIHRRKPAWILPFITVFVLAEATSCGRGTPDASLDPGQTSDGPWLPVSGVAGFGSQCPYGFASAAHPRAIQLWDCPIGSGTVQLEDNIPAILFQADCKKMTITARTADRSIDTAWQAMPDGSFYFTMDGLRAKLSSDGNGGHHDCITPLSADFFGKIDCNTANDDRNLDKAVIHVTANFWAGKGGQQSLTPSPAVSPSPDLPPPVVSSNSVANRCSLPASCYFYTFDDIHQCQ